MKLDRTNRVVYVSREQLRAAEGHEALPPSEEDLATLRSIEKDLHEGAVSFDDLRGPGLAADEEVLPEPPSFVPLPSEREDQIIRAAAGIYRQPNPDDRSGHAVRFLTIEEEPTMLEDDIEAQKRTADEARDDNATAPATTQSQSSGSQPLVVTDQTEHLPPSPSPSAISPTKRAQLLKASHLPGGEVLTAFRKTGSGLMSWGQNLLLITAAPQATTGLSNGKVLPPG